MDKPKDFLEIFWNQVKKDFPLSDCWSWQGKTNIRGVGRIAIEKDYYLVPRLSFQLAYGRIPKGSIFQACGNPRVCKP